MTEMKCFRNLADFKSGKGDSRKRRGDEPEAHNDLRLGPAREMEMMMDGGASEKAFAARVFEVADL